VTFKYLVDLVDLQKLVCAPGSPALLCKFSVKFATSGVELRVQFPWVFGCRTKYKKTEKKDFRVGKAVM
jgi:hypothetical protein